MAEVATAGVVLVGADDVTGPERVAFAVTAIPPSGRHVYQHVILHLRGARVARQVDVEAWGLSL